MEELTVIFNAFASGMGIVFTPNVFGAMMIGIVAGMVVGLIPGLGGLVAHILLIPFALQMGDPLAAIAMLLGVYAVTVQTDSIPAVLLGVPGTAAALAGAVHLRSAGILLLPALLLLGRRRDRGAQRWRAAAPAFSDYLRLSKIILDFETPAALM